MEKVSSLLWLIKNSDGKIIGPYSKEAILNLILRGVLNGEEQISLQPNGNWYEIARDPQFYDQILDVLEGRKANNKVLSIQNIEDNTVLVTRVEKNIPKVETQGDSIQKEDSIKNKPELNKNRDDFFEDIKDEIKKSKKGEGTLKSNKNKNENLKEIVLDKTKLMQSNENTKNNKSDNQNNLNGGAHKKQSNLLIIRDINPYAGETNITQSAPNDKFQISFGDSEKKKLKYFAIVILGIIIGYFILFSNEVNFGSSGGRIHLIAPSDKVEKLNAEEKQKTIGVVKALIENDNYTGWVEAQNLLVKLAESDPTNTAIREMICFVHKELWPFSYQNEEDIKVLNFMSESTNNIKPGNINARSCQLIQSLLTNKIQEAKSQIDILLQEQPSSSFYAWIKSEILYADHDYVNAQAYSSSVVNLWPRFLKTQVIFGRSLENTGQTQQALDVYNSIIKMNPTHKVAKLLAGILEFDSFRSTESSWNLLISATNETEEKAPTLILAKAYRVLAEISLLKNQRNSALSYIEKAIKLNPTDLKIKEIYLSLGGSEKIRISDSKAAEIMALGDQYARTGDCLAAQAEYKTAFDIDPKSSQSGIKAAKCLWKLNQSMQAIDYLKKTIQTNPESFSAYALLADYYSQRFDFNSAITILNQAKNLGPSSYELQKGMAQVELRKNNFTAAAALSGRAAKMYSTDVETYLILAEAELGLGKVSEAFHAAAKAIELDAGNIDAQIIYAKVLYNYQGFDSAKTYLEELIKKSKNIIDYKVAIAEMFKKEEKFKTSLELYQQVVTVDPKNKKAELGLGDSYQGIGQMDKALSSYLTAATIDPTDPESIFKAGMLYIETGRFGPAIQQFERVLLVNKNYPRANYLIGKAAYLQGDMNRAIESAEIEKKINPRLVESYLLSADVYSATRKYQACTAEYQTAIKIQPLSADIYVKLARCFRMTGSYDVAQSMLDIAAEKESGFPDLYKERGALYQAQGEMTAALKSYDKYLALSPSAPDRAEIEILMTTILSKSR